MTAGQAAAAGPAQAGPHTPQWLRDLAAALASTPVPARLRPPDEGGRKSAILVLFGQDSQVADSAAADGAGVAGDLDLLLIQRRAGLRRHGGQPAFPGGAIEPADTSPVQAALREAAEEVGLDPAGVEVVAAGPDLFIAHSGFQVTPVLGWWRQPVPVRVTDPAEVAGATRVRIAELADPANRLSVRHPSGFTGPAFRASGMLVWGFTAALLDELLRLGGWERPWDSGNVQDLPPDMLAAAVPDEITNRAGHEA
ncbi:MAG TPA: CoA pyrophosphatase [Streptosporangiaceae bacterium]